MQKEMHVECSIWIWPFPHGLTKGWWITVRSPKDDNLVTHSMQTSGGFVWLYGWIQLGKFIWNEIKFTGISRFSDAIDKDMQCCYVWQ